MNNYGKKILTTSRHVQRCELDTLEELKAPPSVKSVKQSNQVWNRLTNAT